MTELDRAVIILGKYKPDQDAVSAGRMSARGRLHDCHENPYSEEAEPIQWASWWHGYYGLIRRMEEQDGRS